MKKLWSMIRRISGKPTTTPTNYLIVNGTTIEQTTKIANTFASIISHNSSLDRYTQKFQWYKAHQEKRTINFTSNNLESYNAPFSMTKLQTALHKSHDSAAGPDNIHCQMLKHLPETAQSSLLRAFNDLWPSGEFPKFSSDATSMPKSGNDPTSPNNYRPITWTICVCKTFGRMVNERLVWYLKSYD